MHVAVLIFLTFFLQGFPEFTDMVSGRLTRESSEGKEVG